MYPANRILEALQIDGYVVIPDLVPSFLLPHLREAASRAVAKARDETKNGWAHVRIVGKQFPPWPKGIRDDVWGVQHIMHPELEEPVFSQWYGSPVVLEAVTSILECTEEELQLELCGLLVNPAKTPFSLAWHRDAIPTETPEEREIELLKAPKIGIQWNTALYDDQCLLVVPGSHCRPRTEEERRVTIHDPRSSIPGEMAVKLKAGETVFYDNNILHRAIYPTEPIRQTLHACMGTIGAGFERARNVLQHDMEWVRKAKFDGKLEAMRNNLVKMKDGVGEKELGYSLTG